MGNLGNFLGYGALLVGCLYLAAWLGDRINDRWGSTNQGGKRGSLGCVASIIVWVVLIFLLAQPLSMLSGGMG